MLDQKQITIDGKSYTIQQFPTTTGLEIGISLVKIIAGSAEGFGDVPASGSFLDIWVNPGKIASGLMNKIDISGTPQLIKRMIRESIVQPEFNDEWYEAEFSGEYDNLISFIENVIEVNRYMDMVKKRIPELMKFMESTSSDTNTKD